MSEDKPTPIPIKHLISEDGAHELATSPDMQPLSSTDKGRNARSRHDSAHGGNRRHSA